MGHSNRSTTSSPTIISPTTSILLEDKDRNSFLKDEYLMLQNHYEDFDRRSLTIKGWVATGAIAALALSFNTSYAFAVTIPVFVATVSIIFWYLETKWKMFQHALSDRIRVIEAYFRADVNMPVRQPAPFQTYNYWFRSYVADEPIYDYERAFRPKSMTRRFWSTAAHPFVNCLYVILILLSMISFVLLLAFPKSAAVPTYLIPL
jgi:hypothetical protein